MPAIYLHVPFCAKRCTYCDFITFAGMDAWIPSYVDALRRELRYMADNWRGDERLVGSIFFGGGTPSLLKPTQTAAVITDIRRYFTVLPDCEITLEANPGTLTARSAAGCLEAGINRVSLGVQTFNPQHLKVLGRIHTPEQVGEAVRAFRQAGCENLSLDLIFGLPGQSLQDWQSDLEKAVALAPEHLSLYALILEDGTLMQKWVEEGSVSLPDEDTTADMYEWAMDWLPGKGFNQYEISNWARSQEFESRHNKTYWRNETYLGLGVAAHSRYNDWRVSNVETIPEYIEAMAREPNLNPETPHFSPAVRDKNHLDERTDMQESMFMGLRLVEEGVSESAFKTRFGQLPNEAFPDQIQKLLMDGLLERIKKGDGDHFRMTRRGILLGNRVFREFV